LTADLVNPRRLDPPEGGMRAPIHIFQPPPGYPRCPRPDDSPGHIIQPKQPEYRLIRSGNCRCTGHYWALAHRFIAISFKPLAHHIGPMGL
jgi:hypothetical protein